MICDVENCAAHADVAFTGVEAVENMCLKHGLVALNGSVLQLAKELDDLRKPKPKPKRDMSSVALVMLVAALGWLGLTAAAGLSWGLVVLAYRWILVLSPAVSP